MSNLDDVLNGAFIEQEQQETKSKQIEDRIKSYDGASALLPSRQYEASKSRKVWFNS